MRELSAVNLRSLPLVRGVQSGSRGQTMKRVSATVALCCTLIGCYGGEDPGVSAGGESVASEQAELVSGAEQSLEFSAGALKGIFRDGIQKKAIKGDTRWDKSDSDQVQTSFVNLNALHLHADLAAHKSVLGIGVDIPVDVDALVRIDCDPQNPGLHVSMDDLSIVPHPPKGLNIATAGLVGDIADTMASEKMDEVLAGPLGDGLTMNLDYCPTIRVTSDIGLDLEFFPGSECTTDDTRTEACKAPLVGEGKTFACSHGYWKLEKGGCGTCMPGASPRPARCPTRYSGQAVQSCVDREWTISDISGCHLDPTIDPPAKTGNQP
jgi:hypothetical protein